MVYSSMYEVVVDFTRDYDTIRQALYNVEHYDKTCLEIMLQAASSILLTNWGTQNYNQVVVFTHCGIGLGATSLANTIQKLKTKNGTKNLSQPSTSSSSSSSTSLSPQTLTINEISLNDDWIPFSTSSKLSFVCLNWIGKKYFQHAIELYQKLLDLSGQNGQLFIPKSDKENGKKNINVFGGDTNMTLPTPLEWKNEIIPQTIEKMCNTNYKPFEAILKCGGYHKLEASITIWPPPMPFSIAKSDVLKVISRKLAICGFLSLSDIGSPMSISRHLILANDNPTTLFLQGTSDSEKLENDIKSFYSKTEDGESAGQTQHSEATKESACVLLHGALKFENMAALVLLNEDWYGFIHSYSDSKRKSNMMMTILPPGNDIIPWLGDFRLFGIIEDALSGESPQFPVKPEKRSYSQNCVVWIKQAGLQSDIQKVLRHAKKLPEKTQQFYKELNRIRRAALSLGFVELLEALSTLFEREILLLPPNASPDCSIQLKHSAFELRKVSNRDLKITLMPCPTKFNRLT